MRKNIREATIEDIEDIIILLGEGLREYPVYARYGYNIEKTANVLYQIINSPTDFILVAEYKSNVIGLITGHVIDFAFCDATFGVDNVFYVHPDHRNKSFGPHLFDEFMKKMEELKVNEVRSGSTTGYSSNTIERLLENHGFTYRGVLYDKEM